jgi:hypothetical protein
MSIRFDLRMGTGTSRVADRDPSGRAIVTLAMIASARS